MSVLSDAARWPVDPVVNAKPEIVEGMAPPVNVGEPITSPSFEDIPVAVRNPDSVVYAAALTYHPEVAQRLLLDVK
jgi:hypothetical protein